MRRFILSYVHCAGVLTVFVTSIDRLRVAYVIWLRGTWIYYRVVTDILTGIDEPVDIWISAKLTEIVHATSLSVATVQSLKRLFSLHAILVLQSLAHSLECLILGQQFLEESLPTQGDTMWRILHVWRNEAPDMPCAARHGKRIGTRLI